MLTIEAVPLSPWRPATRVAFRFFAVYFGLSVVTTQMLGALINLPIEMGLAHGRYGVAVLVKGRHVARTITLSTAPTNGSGAGTLAYDQTAADRLVLDGTVGPHAVHMETRLVDHTRFLLLSRGFHCVQEFPFNR